MVRPEEFTMAFMQTRYVYIMASMNRKGVVAANIGDLARQRLVDLDDLNSSESINVKQRRKKLSPTEKLVFD